MLPKKRLRDAGPGHDQQIVGIGFHRSLHNCHSPIVVLRAEQQGHAAMRHQHCISACMLESSPRQVGAFLPVVWPDRRPAHRDPVLERPGGVRKKDPVVRLVRQRLGQQLIGLRIVLGGFRGNFGQRLQIDVVGRYASRPFPS